MVVAEGRRRFLVTLSAEELSAVDAAASAAGLSRAAYVARVLREAVGLESPASSLAKVRAERQKQEDAWTRMKGGER